MHLFQFTIERLTLRAAWLYDGRYSESWPHAQVHPVAQKCPSPSPIDTNHLSFCYSGLLFPADDDGDDCPGLLRVLYSRHPERALWDDMVPTEWHRQRAISRLKLEWRNEKDGKKLVSSLVDVKLIKISAFFEMLSLVMFSTWMVGRCAQTNA